MRKKIALILSKKTYEEKGIWHTSQKYTISSTFSEEFFRCTKNDMRRKTPHIIFLFKGIKHIITKNTPLQCVRLLVAP